MNWRVCYGIAIVSMLLAACHKSPPTSGKALVSADAPIAAEPIAAGATLARTLNGAQLVNRRFSGTVSVVPNDSRNAVTALSLQNATPGGATPTVQADGVVAWMPNEADFASTTTLNLTATLRLGSVVSLSVPVNVRKERTILDAPLPIAAGTLADAAGRYLIALAPVEATQPMTGNLRLLEWYARDGSYSTAIVLPTTSNATVEILDAPVPPINSGTSLAAGSGRATALQSGASRLALPLGAASAAGPMRADVGWFLGGDSLSGSNGNVLNQGPVKVLTTRSGVIRYPDSSDPTISYLSIKERAFQIDANCTTRTECQAIRDTTNTALRRAPIILVHGFNVDKLSTSYGGGTGTWGTLQQALTARGHPVFELRWNTYTRFEEIAGVLATLGKRVAEITGDQAMLVAHSFGGIVAHQALARQGIRYDGQRWVAVDPGLAFRRLITLGSPLSGIKFLANEALGLPQGRDGEISITFCGAVTCYQAGSNDQWDSKEVENLRQKIKSIDPFQIGVTGAEGESIRRLHNAWRTATSAHHVDFATVVSIKRRPYDDYWPDLLDSQAFRLGDGLISIMGQSVLPTDFSSSPFSQSPNLQSMLGANLLPSLDTRSGGADMLLKTINGRTYHFAMRAAHSSAQQVEWTPVYYGIADYPSGGSTLLRVQHPLKEFIENSQYLAESRTAYAGAPPPAAYIVRGMLRLNQAPAAGQVVTARLTSAVTGATVSNELSTTALADGSFRLHLGPLLADTAGMATLRVSDYQVVVNVGDGTHAARWSARQSVAADVNLGTIDITPPAASEASTVFGNVIDGQTRATAVPGVTLYLMKGLHRDETLVRQVQNTSTSRRVVSDLNGQFYVADLQPGDYTVVAEKAGYISQTQGAIYLRSASASSVSFSLLRQLPNGAATISLRWGSATSGPYVSSDLDSHLLKFDVLGSLVYHIYWEQLEGSLTDVQDRDEQSYVGPETTSLQVSQGATYRYWVDNFMWGSGSTLPGSTPSVVVRIGNQSREFTIPRGDAWTERYWHVFDIVNGAVVPCIQNCTTNQSPW